MTLRLWSQAEFYREKAKECRELAQAASSVQQRQRHLELASMCAALCINAHRQRLSEREPSRPDGSRGVLIGPSELGGPASAETGGPRDAGPRPR